MNDHFSSVWCLAVLPNNNLISGSADTTIKIWDTNNGIVIKTLHGHTEGILCLAILDDNDDGDRLASGSFDGTIRIWNIRNENCIKELKVLIKPNTDLYGIWSIVVLKDKRLASGSYDEIIRIWDINNENVVEELSGHTSWIYSIVFHPDNILISGSDDKTIRIWNLSN